MSETICSRKVGIHYLTNNKSPVNIKCICSKVMLFAFFPRRGPIIVVNMILKKDYLCHIKCKKLI